MIEKYENIIICPLFSDIKKYLKETAWFYDLELSLQTSGFLRKVVHYIVCGDKKNIDNFKKEVVQVIGE